MRLFTILALIPAAAHAQQMVSMQTSGDTAIITVRVSSARFTTISGLPYSAKRVTVGMQIRPDGTRIPQNQTANFFRDKAGRNRTEQQVAMRDAPYMTTIMDPILNCEYVLDPGNKIAHRLVDVQIMTAPLSASDEVAAARVAPDAAGVRTEDLGDKTLQGLTVHGTRTSTTWPPGTWNNNDKPVVTEYEAWVAPSLGRLLISSRTTEPDRPDSSYHLENVAVGEPKADLFVPPPDYRIVDEKSDFKIQVPRNPAAPVKLSSHGLSPATTPNAPFSGTRVATGVQTLADGTHSEHPAQTTFSAWRDSQGRVRTEWPPRGIAPGGVEIKDPTTGFVYNLDFVNHIAYRSALTPVLKTPPASPVDPGYETTVAQIGTDMISGVPANGVRTTLTPRQANAPSKVVEQWTARNEGVVLVEKVKTPTESDVVTLKNFSTREPDPGLFRVPATYQILDEYGNQIQAAK